MITTPYISTDPKLQHYIRYKTRYYTKADGTKVKYSYPVKCIGKPQCKDRLPQTDLETWRKLLTEHKYNVDVAPLTGWSTTTVGMMRKKLDIPGAGLGHTKGYTYTKVPTRRA